MGAKKEGKKATTNNGCWKGKNSLNSHEQLRQQRHRAERERRLRPQVSNDQQHPHAS